jgi:superfamily II DNA or RNA helicase
MPSTDHRLSTAGLLICAVDLFNEGVDVPELDTVMMRVAMKTSEIP